jgi:hypothetical protein
MGYSAWVHRDVAGSHAEKAADCKDKALYRFPLAENDVLDFADIVLLPIKTSSPTTFVLSMSVS